MNQPNKSILSILPFDYEGQIKTGRLYMYLYDEIFNVNVFRKIIDTTRLVEELPKHYPNLEYLHIANQISVNENEQDENISEFIIKLEEKLLIDIKNHLTTVYYKNAEAAEICSNIISQYYKKKEESSRFNLIINSTYTDSGLDVEEFEIREQAPDITDNYNEGFEDINKRIITFLNEEKSSGLVLLHGMQGTGKTSYIRHLINAVKKTFIYVPTYMVNEISNPRFLPFMKNYKNSILIIEDCEGLLESRETGNDSSSALSNLLNLGDGLLSDALFLKVICTFNTDLKNIDKAVLRKGRLRVRYEFKELTSEKTGKLFDKLHITDTPAQAMTLAEIYNLKDINDTNGNSSKGIGFKFE